MVPISAIVGYGTAKTTKSASELLDTFLETQVLSNNTAQNLGKKYQKSQRTKKQNRIRVKKPNGRYKNHDETVEIKPIF